MKKTYDSKAVRREKRTTVLMIFLTGFSAGVIAYFVYLSFLR